MATVCLLPRKAPSSASRSTQRSLAMNPTRRLARPDIWSEYFSSASLNVGGSAGQSSMFACSFSCVVSMRLSAQSNLSRDGPLKWCPNPLKPPARMPTAFFFSSGKRKNCMALFFISCTTDSSSPWFVSWKKPQSRHAEPSLAVSASEDSESSSLAMSTSGSSWLSSSPTTTPSPTSSGRAYLSGITVESANVAAAASVISALVTTRSASISIDPPVRVRPPPPPPSPRNKCRVAPVLLCCV
uniref:Uncharacterized protein n=1 Tax=Aegilops tauschii subsp. strangulata TaxID=200361 RepID=A0A452ZJ92_AEGTS